MTAICVARDIADIQAVRHTERRLGARLFGVPGTVGNPDDGGADRGEAVFLCNASARRDLRRWERIQIWRGW
jgi:hypothetical protein